MYNKHCSMIPKTINEVWLKCNIDGKCIHQPKLLTSYCNNNDESEPTKWKIHNKSTLDIWTFMLFIHIKDIIVKVHLSRKANYNFIFHLYLYSFQRNGRKKETFRRQTTQTTENKSMLWLRFCLFQKRKKKKLEHF